MKRLAYFLAFFTMLNASAQSPIAESKKIADYIIAHTTFQYSLQFYQPSHQLTELQYLDFGRTFGNIHNIIAFAVTDIQSSKDTTVQLEFSTTSAVMIQINGQMVYKNLLPTKLQFETHERSIKLGKKLQLKLHKGNNRLLIKSVSNNEKEWKFLLQCADTSLKVGLYDFIQLDNQVTMFTNFLVAGGFCMNNTEDAFKFVFPIEQNSDLTSVYNYDDFQYGWTIPKLELTPVNPTTSPYWGAYNNFNYHAAGLAWAIAELGKMTNVKAYKNYTRNYCNFILKCRPFITNQVKNLWQTNCLDFMMVNTPLLDFTSATAMPFLFQLTEDSTFNERKNYTSFYEEIKQYIFHEQIRLPEGNFTRKTPEIFTTWVDDMFMGLPFVIHSTKLTSDATEKKSIQDDAASQVIAFTNLLLDKKDSLFHHAKMSAHPETQFPYWLRANGWGLWAITEVLKGLPKNHIHYPAILKIYKANVEALLKHQDKNGLWHNIINIPSSRLETSGSAIITLAIARGINEGWLDKAKYTPIAIKAWNAISKKIEPDGEVEDIIVGSMTNQDYHYYENQPLVKNDSHGMFCVMMCGLEMSKLLTN